MPKGHRHQGLPFTCSNSRYRTAIDKGFPHGAGRARGSVTAEPLYDDGSNSLWFEYVIEGRTGEEAFWFMWYDADGHPNIIESAVIDKDHILGVATTLLVADS